MLTICIPKNALSKSSLIVMTSGLIVFILLSPTVHGYVNINPHSNSLNGLVPTTIYNNEVSATFCSNKCQVKSLHLSINRDRRRSALHATPSSFLRKLISPKSSKDKKEELDEIENKSTPNITKAEVMTETNDDKKESKPDSKPDPKPDPKPNLQIKDKNSESDDNNQSSPSQLPSAPTKIRQLKDRMWVREALEDLTSSEFACTLSREISNNSNNNNITSKEKKLFPPVKSKRAVDFEALLQKLDVRIEEMCVVGDMERDESCFIAQIQGEDMCFVLKENEGMGSVVYTQDQRESLLERILSTREQLTKAMSGTTSTPEDSSNLDQIRSKLQEKSLSNNEVDTSSSNEQKTFLYVRDDGTVDWDGALQDREALRLFGSSVWARINGQDPTLVEEGKIIEVAEGGGEADSGIRVKIVETEQIKALRETLENLKVELKEMEGNHTKLLNSAISPTTPNAKVNMASISAPLRTKIKASTTLLDQKRDAVTFASLNYELERVFTYLEADLGNTFSKGYIPLQDRLAVAEFGLLESQITSLNQQLTLEGETDNDVLQVIMDQMTDFKRRLGIDYYVNTAPTWDSEAIRMRAVDLLEKSKEGIGFYVKGCKLLWNDIIFCIRLLNRAIQGYTLKPREVRNLRRTFSDVITFIPFVIILLIPLSPVGHVFVFGAIQRFFPDFFPSMFTERRQNLLQLYESTEYSEITINENWKEKLLRFSEASLLMTANSLKKLYNQLEGKNIEDDDTTNDNTEDTDKTKK